MRQVLFYVPLHSISDALPDVPVYGYGMMLFLAFVLCGWLAGRLSAREGIDRKVLPDLAIWLFVTGILGARVTFIIQEWPAFANKPWSLPPSFAAMPWSMIALWDGGLVFYGSIFGGGIGYILAHRRLLAPEHVSPWKMIDVLAPCIALGLALGRVGCLLTGCCFGNVACPDCPYLTFPLPSAPTQEMARLGYQTLAGFTVNGDTLRVWAVEPGSAAEQAGLQVGDEIVKVNGADLSRDKAEKLRDGVEMVLTRYDLLNMALAGGWPAGLRKLHLAVKRGPDQAPVELPPFLPRSLPLHPTQLYETISMGLLLFFLLSYYPYKQRDGSVIVLLMLGYGLHRFLNEMLRVDNPPVFLGLTFSQVVSLLVLAAAAVLGYFVFVRRPSPSVVPP